MYPRYVNFVRTANKLPMDVIGRHVAHEEDETNPWHERSIHILGNEVCPSGADEEGPDTSPKIEEADEIEEGDPRLGSETLRQGIDHVGVRYDEQILPIGFGIGYTL